MAPARGRTHPYGHGAAGAVHALNERVHRAAFLRGDRPSGGTWLSPELRGATADEPGPATSTQPPAGPTPRPAVAVLHAVLWAAMNASAVASGWLTVPDSGHLLFWPAAGFGSLWIQQTPRAHLAPNLALLLTSTAVVDLLLGIEPAPAVAYALTSLVMACTTRWVLSRSAPGVIALARAAVVAGLVGAPLGLLSGYLTSGDATAFEAFTWVVRSTTGIFVVVGLALAVLATRHARIQGVSWSDLVTNEPRATWAAELAATVLVTVVALVVVFDGQDGVSLAFVLVAVAAYVGFRFAPVVASVYITAAAMVAILATLAGRGPFSSIVDPDMRAVAVRVFVLVQAAIALTLSWAVRERHELTVRLLAAQRDADDRAQLLDAVTNRLEYGVAVLDGRGRVVVRNDAAARLIPVPLEELGEPFDPARYGVHGPDGEPLDILDMEHAKALAAGQGVSTSVVVRGPRDGHPDDRYLRVRIDPLELRDGAAHRLAVVSLRDDTSHRQRIKDLEAFTGVIAHDLRNPLAALSTWTEVLTDHLDDRAVHDDQTREAIERITITGDRMGRLVSDLLAYATASSAPLDLTAVSLRELVAEVVQETAAATGRDPRVTVDGDDAVHADPVLARQVFANVIGNAVKYTADGVRPALRVTAHHDARRSATVVEVSDNGVGVPAHMRDAVFDGFTRVRATARSRPGAGLGLAICARALQRHDGTITLAAGPGGVGSTVTMTFPAPPSA